jgi:hypothetical protein
MALCWIINWFMQSHWLADEARLARIWKWWLSILGPHWQRDWETLPNTDTNGSSWVSNQVLPEQKFTTLILQKPTSWTVRVNAIRWPEKQTLRHSIKKTRKTNTGGRAPFWLHFQVFFLPLCTSIPLHNQEICSPSDNAPKSFSIIMTLETTRRHSALVLISYWFQLFVIHINQRGTMAVKFH